MLFRGFIYMEKMIYKWLSTGIINQELADTLLGDVKEEIRNDTKAVTFYLENGFVRHGKYEPPSAEDMKRTPEGYAG